MDGTQGVTVLSFANVMIPKEIHGQRYISLATYRKSGVAVPTPIWFVEADGLLYVMTRGDSGKCKRVRNNPRVSFAPCTMRGRVTGPEFPGTARILPETDWEGIRALLRKKYWLMRVPFFWSSKNVFVEIPVR